MALQNDCFQCGSYLIEVDKKREGSLTVTTFKCSNKVCQSETDEKVSAARQRIKDHLEAKRLRLLQKEEWKNKLAP